jgi:hypothetical protein
MYPASTLTSVARRIMGDVSDSQQIGGPNAARPNEPGLRSRDGNELGPRNCDPA